MLNSNLFRILWFSKVQKNGFYF